MNKTMSRSELCEEVWPHIHLVNGCGAVGRHIPPSLDYAFSGVGAHTHF